MICNVVLARLRAPVDAAGAAADRRQADAGLAGIRTLQLPGLLANEAGWDTGLRAGGWDTGLRAGGWDTAINNDWLDAESYRTYDADPEHGRFRQLIVEVCEQVARVQFELVPAAGP